ncbi:3252_t:CDS:2, partial [Racocetra persica]
DEKVVAMSQLHQTPERTNAYENIISEGDWDVVLNEWEELLIDKELEEE